MSAPPRVDVDAPAEAPPRPGTTVVQLRIDRAVVVPAVAAVLIAGHLLLRGWAAASGWLTGPDFLAAAVAAGLPVEIPGPPGAVGLARGVAAIAPLSWPALVGLELLGQLLVDLLLYRLLVELFGRRPAVLLPLTLYLASSLTLPGGLWWSAALVQLPLQLALLVAVRGHVQALRTGARAPLVTSALAIAAGVLFAVEAALVPLLLLAGTALWATGGPPAARLRALARLRLVWAAHLVAVAVGLGVRLLASGAPLVDGAALAGGLRALPDVLTRTVLPGLVGGPWRWEAALAPLATPDPPIGLVRGAPVALALVVLASVLVHRGALRAWLLAAVVVVTAVLGASAAGATAGAVPAGLVPPATVALVVALAAGLAFLPVREAPRVLARRGWTTRGAAVRATDRVARTGVGLAVAAALVAGAVLSTAGFTRHWSANAGSDFVDNAKADLTGRAELVLADGPVPSHVVPEELAPANRASVVLAGLPRLPAFLAEGQVVDEIVTLDDQGHGQLAVVDPVSTSGPGLAPDCGWPAGDDPAEVELPRATPDGRWLVQISYFAGMGNLVTVRAGDTAGAGVAEAGVHNLFVQVTGSVDRVVLEVADREAPLCVTSVAVGQPLALVPGAG
ncbi:hypothetical protein [Blastococcus sp. KM273128]|uniref:hypothetical protein n=1 Tax=Blastococcus sp. KM273128 TaxID=2570314 RepID=UPI001F419C02|nr:hypothetical protein [Blastococcus sp. KM273128]